MAVMMENIVVNTDDLSDFDEKGSQSSDNEHGTNASDAKSVESESSDCSLTLFACDGCNGSLSGKYRTTCLICPGFDLCDDCMVACQLQERRFGKHTFHHPVRRVFTTEQQLDINDEARAKEGLGSGQDSFVDMPVEIQMLRELSSVFACSDAGVNTARTLKVDKALQLFDCAETAVGKKFLDSLQAMQMEFGKVLAQVSTQQGKMGTAERSGDTPASQSGTNDQRLWLLTNCSRKTIKQQNNTGDIKHPETRVCDSSMAFSGAMSSEDVARRHEMLSSIKRESFNDMRCESTHKGRRTSSTDSTVPIGVCPLSNGLWRAKAYIGGDLKFVCDAETGEQAAAYHDAATRLFLNATEVEGSVNLIQAIEAEIDPATNAVELDAQHPQLLQHATGKAWQSAALVMQQDCCKDIHQEDAGANDGPTSAGRAGLRQRADASTASLPEYALNFPSGHPEVDRIMNSHTLESLTGSHEPKTSYDDDFYYRELETGHLHTMVGAGMCELDDGLLAGDDDDLEEESIATADDPTESASENPKNSSDEPATISSHLSSTNMSGSDVQAKIDSTCRPANGLKGSDAMQPAEAVATVGFPDRVALEPKTQAKFTLLDFVVVSRRVMPALKCALSESEVGQLLELVRATSTLSMYRVLQDLERFCGSNFSQRLLLKGQEMDALVAEAAIAVSAVTLCHLNPPVAASDALRRTDESTKAWSLVAVPQKYESSVGVASHLASPSLACVSEDTMGHHGALSSTRCSFDNRRDYACLITAVIQRRTIGLAAESQSVDRLSLHQRDGSSASAGLASNSPVLGSSDMPAQLALQDVSDIETGNEAAAPSFGSTAPIQLKLKDAHHEVVANLLEMFGVESGMDEIVVHAPMGPAQQSQHDVDPSRQFLESIMEKVQSMARRRLSDSDGEGKDDAQQALISCDVETICNSCDVQYMTEHLRMHGLRLLLQLYAKEAGASLQPWQTQSVCSLTLGGNWLASAALAPLARRVVARFRRTPQQLAKGLGVPVKDLNAWLQGLPMHVQRSMQVCSQARKWLSEVRRSGGLWSLNSSKKQLPDPVIHADNQAKMRQEALQTCTSRSLTRSEVRRAARIVGERALQTLHLINGITRRKKLKLTCKFLRWATSLECYASGLEAIAARNKSSKRRSKSSKVNGASLERRPGESQRAYRKRQLDAKKSRSATSVTKSQPVRRGATSRPRANARGKRTRPKLKPKAKPGKKTKARRSTARKDQSRDDDFVMAYVPPTRSKEYPLVFNEMLRRRNRDPAYVSDPDRESDEETVPNDSDSDYDDDKRCSVCGSLDAPCHDPIASCNSCGVRCHAYCNGIGLQRPSMSHQQFRDSIKDGSWESKWKCDMCSLVEEQPADGDGGAQAAGVEPASGAGADSAPKVERPQGPLAWARPVFKCRAKGEEGDHCRLCGQDAQGMARKPSQGFGWVHTVCAMSAMAVRWQARSKLQWPDVDLHEIRMNSAPMWSGDVGESPWFVGRLSCLPTLDEVKTDSYEKFKNRCYVCKQGGGHTIPCREHSSFARKMQVCQRIAHPSCSLRIGSMRTTYLRHSASEADDWYGDNIVSSEFDPAIGDILDSASAETREVWGMTILRNEGHAVEQNRWKTTWEVEGPLKPTEFEELCEYRGKPEYQCCGVSYAIYAHRKSQAMQDFLAEWQSISGKDMDFLDHLMIAPDGQEDLIDQATKISKKHRALISMHGQLGSYNGAVMQYLERDVCALYKVNNRKPCMPPEKDVMGYGRQEIGVEVENRKGVLMRMRHLCKYHNTRGTLPPRYFVGESAGMCCGFAVPRWWTSLMHLYNPLLEPTEKHMRRSCAAGKPFPKVKEGQSWAEAVKEAGLSALWRKRPGPLPVLDSVEEPAACGEASNSAVASSNSSAAPAAVEAAIGTLQVQSSVVSESPAQGVPASATRSSSRRVAKRGRSQILLAHNDSGSTSPTRSSTTGEHCGSGAVSTITNEDPGGFSSAASRGEAFVPVPVPAVLPALSTPAPSSKRRRVVKGKVSSGVAATSAARSEEGQAVTPPQSSASDKPSPGATASAISTGERSEGRESPESWAKEAGLSIAQQRRLLRAARRNRGR